MNQYRHLSFPFSSSSFLDFRLPFPHLHGGKTLPPWSFLIYFLLWIVYLDFLPKHPDMFLFSPLCMYHLASAQQKQYIWRDDETRAQQVKGMGEKIPGEFFPWEVFVLLRSNFYHIANFADCFLALSWVEQFLGILTLNFGIRSTNHPATVMKQQKATCLLQCHCPQCDGERLSDSKKCLSPQISWAPSNRNIPCFASPVLTHWLSFEADLPLSLSTEALPPLSTAEFLLLFNADVSANSVQSGLIPGSLSQESRAEAWDTCDFQETPSLPVFFPTWAPYICISCLTSHLCFSIFFSVPPFICLFDFPSGCPHRHLFNIFLVRKTSSSRMNMG